MCNLRMQDCAEMTDFSTAARTQFQAAGLSLVVNKTFIELKPTHRDHLLAGVSNRDRGVSDFFVSYADVDVVRGPSHCLEKLDEVDVETCSVVSNDMLDERTTVVIRGLPHSITREWVCEMLSESFDQRQCYDFVHVPVDFWSWKPFGHAFVNFASHEDALRFMQCAKLGDVSWSSPLQGLQELIDHYRNSPVMSSSVAEIHKPVLIVHGRRINFPCPTKRIRRPRARRTAQYSNLRNKIEESVEDRSRL